MTKPAVLVIDDDRGVRESLRVVLDSDYEVLDTAEGATACRVIQSYPIRAVVLDLLLEDVDGLEVLQELRAIAPGLPVVILTAVKTVRTAVGAMKLGASDYLTKPFDADELLTAVRRGIHVRPDRAPHAPLRKGRLGHGPSVLILGPDAGRRAVLDVAIGRCAVTEVAETWTELLQRRAGSVPMSVIVDTDTPLDALTFLRTLPARTPGCHLLLLQGARPVARAWLSLLETSLRPLPIDEVVNRVRILVSTRAASAGELPRMSPQLGRALEWLASHYKDNVTLERLASVAGLSPHRFSRTFQAETGLPYRVYVSKVRVAIARCLLATTDAKIETIAREVGFFDASHLSRTYVGELGRRPSRNRPRS